MARILKYRKKQIPSQYVRDSGESRATVCRGDALEFYEGWETPTAIISDGPYGLAKYPGDPRSTEGLAELYAPHIAAWSRLSSPSTTLWFWCSELGWAEVHAALKLNGWKYKAAHIWDKGIGHIAGNCNGDSIRGFPVVTEVCVQYVREARLKDECGNELDLKDWLRSEWARSGLPFYKTNEACGVKNAATRKYFTKCHLWYFPPAEKMAQLAEYATRHGKPTDRPYFSIDGTSPLTASQWAKLRAKWNHAHGVSNVWCEPAVRGKERFRAAGLKSLHANQKPLSLMHRIIAASTDPADVVWEPFGGLCSASVAALQCARNAYAAELLPEFFDVASKRIEEASLYSSSWFGESRGA